jgi:hypothetical protein
MKESLFTATWSRLSKTLKDDGDVYRFICRLVDASKIGCESNNRGLLVFKPALEAAESDTASPEPDYGSEGGATVMLLETGMTASVAVAADMADLWEGSGIRGRMARVPVVFTAPRD